MLLRVAAALLREPLLVLVMVLLLKLVNVRYCLRGLMMRRRRCSFGGGPWRESRLGCVACGRVCCLKSVSVALARPRGIPHLNTKAAAGANFQQHVLVAAKLCC